MRGNSWTCLACAGAVVAASACSADRAVAQPNCPVKADQLVLVPIGEPVAFTLDVTDLGTGTVSIFQFPLGGILEQVGPLDFVFVPQVDFRGTTQLTYRLTPPVRCPRGTELGRVTLAGGNAGSLAEGNATTASGIVEPPGFFNLLVGSACGAGFAPMSLLTFAALMRARRSHRRMS